MKRDPDLSPGRAYGRRSCCYGTRNSNEKLEPLMEARNRIIQDSEYWANVLDAIPAGLSLHTADGVVVNANKRLGLIYDCPPEAFLGRTCADLFHEGPPQCPHDHILQSISEAEVITVLGPKAYQVILSAVVGPRGLPC